MFKSKPYIIAEVGSNWITRQDCLDSITQAKLSGADAVKFQLYDYKSLYGIRNFGTTMPGALPKEWLKELKDQADRQNINFMCSAFSPELIHAVDPFVSIHKIASAEMCHVKMLEKLRDIGKTAIVSTGAQTVPDIRRALDILGKTPVTLMYCVASYPAHETDLEIIQEMRNTFALPVGFSDHSLDYLNLPHIAVNAFGATVIEKHFTAIQAKTPDSGHSLNPDQFKKMIQKIKGKYDSFIGPTPGERDMILKHKRRLKAIKKIKTGDKLKYGVNFGIYRSLTEDTFAMNPLDLYEADGKRCRNNRSIGDGIRIEDVRS